MKKILLTMLLLLSVIFIFSGCNSNSNFSDEKNNTNEIYMNQKGSWSNGVEFSIYNHKETSELDFGLYKYTTDDKFLVVGLRVYNGSSKAFTADATDVWLLMGETKIYQQNIVERHAQGYDDISQSPTVTKEYFLFFEIGNNISMSDLNLVINNGGFINSESLIIKLKNAPKDSKVILNYAYDDKIENYNFYSGTSIVPSNFPTPYREGYKFSGWYFNDDYSGSSFDSLVLEQNKTLTLYAKWDVINVNIIYNGNGNTGGETENQVAQIGSSIIIRENNYTKEGFYFVGWTESVGGHEIIAPNTIYDLSLSEKDITLYAKWAKDIYSIEDFNSIKENDDCIFVLKNDIDFNGTSAKTVTLFKGIFEGNYFSIKNSSSPLFLENNGIINNVVVENCELSKFDNYLYNGSSVTEGDINFNYAFGGIVAINRGTIKNSLINLSIIKDFPTGTTSCFGGIVAINVGGSIICCKSNISATHNNIGESLCWGGIVGISSNSINKGVIGNCYSTGTLDLPQKGDENPSKELVIGGILGFGKNITIKNSISIIDMNIAMNYTTFKDIGGILGQSGYGNVVIDSCVTIGNINCLDVGIVYVGGIACDSGFAYTVKNCYSNNSITLMYGTSYYVENGIRVSRDSFLQADFYSNNDILEFFIDLDTLKYNENAVWIIADGELPKLYWETN